MGTVRITSNQSSPTTSFYQEADVVSTDASFGDHGRWRIRFYLRCVNGGNTSSFYGGSGTQTGQRSLGAVWSTFDTHSGTPFLPSGYQTGATRWNDGPTYLYVEANDDGYWRSDLTSMPLRMLLNYGSVDIVASGSLPVSRIARAPGAPGAPGFTDVAPGSVTINWAAAARGNADIDQYQWQISTTASFSSITTSGTPSGTTGSSAALTAGTVYYARVRAHNSDGYGPWSATSSFTTPSGAYVSQNGVWVSVPILVSDGAVWEKPELLVSDSDDWVEAI